MSAPQVFVGIDVAKALPLGNPVPNTSESRLPHGSVQSHHETCAGNLSRVERHVAVSYAR